LDSDTELTDGAKFNEELLTDLSAFTIQSVKNILELLRKLLRTLTEEGRDGQVR
jgi:hypothetical protein